TPCLAARRRSLSSCQWMAVSRPATYTIRRPTDPSALDAPAASADSRRLRHQFRAAPIMLTLVAPRASPVIQTVAERAHLASRLLLTPPPDNQRSGGARGLGLHGRPIERGWTEMEAVGDLEQSRPAAGCDGASVRVAPAGGEALPSTGRSAPLAVALTGRSGLLARRLADQRPVLDAGHVWRRRGLRRHGACLARREPHVLDRVLVRRCG